VSELAFLQFPASVLRVIDLAPFFSVQLKKYGGGRYVVGVSGGMDSIVLLHLMIRTIPSSKIVVAHFNHALRGEASELDEALVRKLCREHGVTLHVGRAHTKHPAEAALREDRYRFLFEIKAATGSDFLVTAHHANDQLETLFMRLLRGGGPKALGGMQERAIFSGMGQTILRPLLGVPRSVLLKYAVQNRIEHREDESNQSSLYFRNRVRSELAAPFLALSNSFGGEEKLLPRLHENLAELRWMEKEIEKTSRRKLQRCVTQTPLWTRLDALTFLKSTPRWQSRMLRTLLLSYAVCERSRSEIKRVLEKIRFKKCGFEISGGISVTRSCEFLYFQTEAQRNFSLDALRWNRKGDSYHCPLLALTLELRGIGGDLRFFQPGDRFLGHKLKEHFLERRIPRPERGLIPLLARTGTQEVLWVFPEQKEGVIVRDAGFPFAVK
jgi:tRNA(Ile)-lysidine synthetase-like protein